MRQCRKVAERIMDIWDLQDVAQLCVIVTMKEGHAMLKQHH